MKEDNKRVLESPQELEEVVILENLDPQEAVAVNENVEQTEDQEGTTTKKQKKTDSSKLTSRLQLFTTTGLVAMVGVVLASSGTLVNYNYNATFENFAYEDGRINYEISYNDFALDNDLHIILYEDDKMITDYKLIYDYNQMQIDLDLLEVEVSDTINTTKILLDDQVFSDYLNERSELEQVLFALENEEFKNYSQITLTNQGKSGVIKGFFEIDVASIASKIKENGKSVRFDAKLVGSTGLVERTFDNYAIKVSKLISEFKSISGHCDCSVDGYYKINLDYVDDNAFFSFQEIYMVDSQGNESSHISNLINWHDEIKIPVLNLNGGSADIHLVYRNTETNELVELIFLDGESQVFVKYDDGPQEVFKDNEIIFDIKI